MPSPVTCQESNFSSLKRATDVGIRRRAKRSPQSYFFDFG